VFVIHGHGKSTGDGRCHIRWLGKRIIHRNGDPDRAEDLIMGGIFNRPSREFRWKNGTLHKRGKACQLR
jgi:hypothetical protein